MNLLIFNSPTQDFEQGLSANERQDYLGSAVIVFNLRTKQLVFSSILEVSRVGLKLLYFLLFSLQVLFMI